MFIALYEMIAKPKLESAFESAWADVTEAIFRVRGSLGSRLHRTEAPRTYVAYAQWPSQEGFEQDPSSFKYSENELRAFEKMRETAESINFFTA